MQQTMKPFLSVCGLMLSLTVGAVAVAQDNYSYFCEHGGGKRTIAVVYVQGTPVPCEVTYEKEDGDFQVLWRAENSQGYCENKADEFVMKQEDWGWSCDRVHGVPAASESNDEGTPQTADQDVLDATADNAEQ